MSAANEDLKRQLDEAWAERDRARGLQKSAEAQAASFLRQCMEIGALRLIDQGIADARALEIKNLTDAFRVRVEITDAQQAEIEGLKGNLAKVRGPECQNKECLDYDGEHPFHQNIAAVAHEQAQKPMREEIEKRKALAEGLKAKNEALMARILEMADQAIAARKWFELDTKAGVPFPIPAEPA